MFTDLKKKKLRIVIKIGSSSITNGQGEIDQPKLEKLADEIIQLKEAGHEVALVSSGAVAAGYRKLGCLERPNTLIEKQAAASIGQGLLMEAYSNHFLSKDYVSSQILITKTDFIDEKCNKNIKNTLNILLERGMIPIVNENDSVAVDHLKFGDNDRLSALVASLIDADQLIILSDIDGLYNKHPKLHSDAILMEQVNRITPEIETVAGNAGSNVGTGGMQTKIKAVKIALASGIPSFIGNANKDNIAYDAVYGKAKGTYFMVKTKKISLDHQEVLSTV